MKENISPTPPFCIPLPFASVSKCPTIPRGISANRARGYKRVEGITSIIRKGSAQESFRKSSIPSLPPDQFGKIEGPVKVISPIVRISENSALLFKSQTKDNYIPLEEISTQESRTSKYKAQSTDNIEEFSPNKEEDDQKENFNPNVIPVKAVSNPVAMSKPEITNCDPEYSQKAKLPEPVRRKSKRNNGSDCPVNPLGGSQQQQNTLFPPINEKNFKTANFILTKTVAC